MKEQPGAGLSPQVAALRRSAWIPQTEAGDGPPAASKFAGTPYTGDSGGRPLCPNCRLPIQLFLQLDLAQLPEAARGEYGEGFLQFFHCTNPETGCDQLFDTSPHFSKGIILRLLPAGDDAPSPEGGGAAPDEAHGGPRQGRGGGWREAAKGLLGRMLTAAGGAPKWAAGSQGPPPPRRIVGWREADDYPHFFEAEELVGPELSEEIDTLEFPLGGDKLGGWPGWVQDVDYPDCPVCGERMRHVFQIASEQNLRFCFGDMGTGHITQCREHKEVMAFYWAST